MLAGKSILVVDDELDLREILCEEFQLVGARATAAANGTEAYEKIQKNQFDLVLSDLRMPGGDGVTLAKKLKAQPQSPVLLLMTGYADLTAEDAFDIGAEGFVTKPFHLHEIRSTILRLLTPAPERWASWATENEKSAQAEVQLDSAIFKGHSESSYLGRGGIFLPGDQIPARTNQELKFRIGEWLEGKGVVRWVRPNSSSGRGPGVGVEFLHLKPESVNQVEALLAQQKPVAYLPKGF